MRISSLQSFVTGTSQIIDLSGQVNKTQEQISRGTRILTPSDDPVASSQIQKLNQENNIREQYMDNINLLNSRLELEESVLDSANDTIIRIRELAIQANNGALTVDDRRAIAAEVEVRMTELADLMNTKDASNEYLFSGFKGSTVPFLDNGSGNYTYQGDEGQRFVQVAASTYIPSNDSGKEVFVNVSSADPTFQAFDNPNNRGNPPATISTGFVYDQEEFNQFYPEDYIIEFQNPDDMTLLGKSPSLNYNIIQKSDGRVIESNVPYTSGRDIQFNGISIKLSGVPATGDSYLVESKDTQDILTTVNRFLDGMRSLTLSPDDQESYQNLISTTIANLDHAQTSILETRSQIGARLNTIDSTQALHEEVEIVTTELLSTLRDLDYAEAVSQLTFESFVLEAAQQSYARISGLSLFNSL
ncbi:MAG: flagellar hook-associated protein FlgL [Candidatus Pelagadaptatus aseana]|uniref:flagellar hook-associated protein FlgL n=1 Tax=Candidatus Pelagadaptatus aseana TaxID=3120508 RepID=UPI0039B324D2